MVRSMSRLVTGWCHAYDIRWSGNSTDFFRFGRYYPNPGPMRDLRTSFDVTKWLHFGESYHFVPVWGSSVCGGGVQKGESTYPKVIRRRNLWLCRTIFFVLGPVSILPGQAETCTFRLNILQVSGGDIFLPAEVKVKRSSKLFVVVVIHLE